MRPREVREWTEAGIQVVVLAGMLLALYNAAKPAGRPDRDGGDDRDDYLILDDFDLSILDDEGNAVRVQSEQGEVYGLESIDYEARALAALEDDGDKGAET